MIVLGLASMGLDRYRRWRKDRATTQPPGPADQRSSG